MQYDIYYNGTILTFPITRLLPMINFKTSQGQSAI